MKPIAAKTLNRGDGRFEMYKQSASSRDIKTMDKLW